MRILAFACSLLILTNAYGQSKDLKRAEGVSEFTISEVLGTPKSIHITSDSKLSKTNPKTAISDLLDIGINELRETQSTAITDAITIKRYHRYINGIKVAHGNYSAIVENGSVRTIHAEHYDRIDTHKKPRLTEKKAFHIGIRHINSQLFSWEATENLLKSNVLTQPQREALEKTNDQEIPNGELVYVRDYANNTYQLEMAYMFLIESVAPEFRDKVYVSANDGRILLRDPQLKHGVGDTRYSGRKTFPSTRITIDTFELKGTEPISGIFCETRSLEGLGGTPVSTPAIIALSQAIRDGDETTDPCPTDMGEVIGETADDRWNEAEHRKVPFDGTLHTCCPTYIPGQCSEVRNDDIALDAHWGAAMVARYWKDIHNRNGYDNAGAELLSFVHHGEGYENASWNGLYMKYGDGAYQDGTNPAGMFGPLVSLDVCAHEIGHAICTSTSDLVYVGESGAMNEGFSDIWAASIEQYVLDSIDNSLSYITWGIGEQIDQRDDDSFNSATARALRWMDHPPAENNPDTYGAGTWWQDPDCASPSVANDFCGVHFNSGVLNKWFYLLTVGSGQAFSPGNGKPAADDEVNDKGNSYSVTGIGIRKAEKITYGAELLLMPNSRFADMRSASIDIARSLYGPCSDEVEQTIKAWYAVGVGEDFISCGPTIAFNQFNPTHISETSEDQGCSADKMVSLNLHSYMVDAEITLTTTGNAILGVDYDLCHSTLTFSGDESKVVDIVIYDDKIEENEDTIIVHFSGGGFSGSDTIIILNDDGIPAIGNSALLFYDDFEVDDGSWTQELVNPTSMINGWHIDTGNTNQAHISYDPVSSSPTYTQLVESHVRLVSPEINAIGRKNVNVSFDFEAGGERDAIAPDALFDFGTFQISFDGFNWIDINNYVGTPETGGQVTISGTYSTVHSELSNRTFFLGFTWQNDALNGSAFSFKIDNVTVTGEGLEIASDADAQMSTQVPSHEQIAFVSDQNEIIGIIEDAQGDLGCTTLKVSENNGAQDLVASQCNYRGTKVFSILDENDSDSLTVTLFYKESEIDDWANPILLNVLAVKDQDINIEMGTGDVIDVSHIQVNDASDNGSGYISYTFTTSSEYQSFALTDRPSAPQTNIVMNNLNSGLASLRDIIESACPNDTIRFSPSTIGDTFQLTSCDISIDKDLVIIGNGISETVLSGHGLHRFFSVPSTVEVQFESLQIIDNNVDNDATSSCYNGCLSLKDVEITGH